MRKYLLDTNICVHFLRGNYNLDFKFEQVQLENCFLCEITLAELEYGVENSATVFQKQQRDSLQKLVTAFADRILPTRDGFPVYAKNRAKLRKLGTPISDFDLLIGSTAVVNDLVMVTENITEFARIENIQLENWIVRD